MALDSETVKQLCRELYKRQRCLFIGQPENHGGHLFQLGETTSYFCQFDIGAVFSIDDVATAEDYNRQSDLIAELRPDWRRFPSPAGGRFFKIHAVPKI